MASSTAMSLSESTTRLESMPADILVHLMVTIHIRHSADLAATIRASPILFSVFQSSKIHILLAPVLHDLGPAIRDAIAVLRVSQPVAPADISEEDLITHITDHITQYRQDLSRIAARPSSPSHLLTHDIALPLAISLLKLNKDVQFLTDRYATRRLNTFSKIHTHRHHHHTAPPDALTRPLTRTERQRIGQALLRGQLLAILGHGASQPQQPHPGYPIPPPQIKLHPSPSTQAVLLSPFTLFEAEQICQAQVFLQHLMLEACEFNIMPPLIRGEEGCSFLEPQCNLARVWIQTVAYTWRALRKPGFAEEDDTNTSTCIGDSGEAQNPSWPSWHGFQFIRQEINDRHRLEGCWFHATQGNKRKRGNKRKPGGGTTPVIPESADITASEGALLDVPYAWIDGFAGSWNHMPPFRALEQWKMTGANRELQNRSLFVLNHWTWAGFVFWDRERVEALKESLHDDYRTGWMASLAEFTSGSVSAAQDVDSMERPRGGPSHIWRSPMRKRFDRVGASQH